MNIFGTRSLDSRKPCLKQQFQIVTIINPDILPGFSLHAPMSRIGPNGQIIGTDKRFKISVTMESTRLIVTGPLISDSGKYTLKAQNAAGVKTLTFNLNVEGNACAAVCTSYFL